MSAKDVQRHNMGAEPFYRSDVQASVISCEQHRTRVEFLDQTVANDHCYDKTKSTGCKALSQKSQQFIEAIREYLQEHKKNTDSWPEFRDIFSQCLGFQSPSQVSGRPRKRGGERAGGR
jgi:hypothetical protein